MTDSQETAIQRELRRNREQVAAEEARQVAQNIQTAEITEQIRQDIEDSDVGEVHRQNAEAERIMRLPTPEALDELGSVVGNPLHGPAS